MTQQVPRRFYLQRDTDITGVSGTGIVADGIVWPDNSVSVRWRGARPSVVFWTDFSDVLAIHGHDGATRVVWLDYPTEPVDMDTPCAHCDPPSGHRTPSHGSWGVRVDSERDSDGQPVAVRVERSNGAHVAGVDAQWIRSLIDAAQKAEMAPRAAEPDMSELYALITTYAQIAEQAFNGARLVDAAGDPIYTDYQDWYAHSSIEVDTPPDADEFRSQLLVEAAAQHLGTTDGGPPPHSLADICQPEELSDGTVVRVHGDGELDDTGRRLLNDVAQAARRKYANEPPNLRRIAIDAITDAFERAGLDVPLHRRVGAANAVLRALDKVGALVQPDAEFATGGVVMLPGDEYIPIAELRKRWADPTDNDGCIIPATTRPRDPAVEKAVGDAFGYPEETDPR